MNPHESLIIRLSDRVQPFLLDVANKDVSGFLAWTKGSLTCKFKQESKSFFTLKKKEVCTALSVNH